MSDEKLTVLTIIPAKNGFILRIMDNEDDDDYETQVFTSIDEMTTFIETHYEGDG